MSLTSQSANLIVSVNRSKNSMNAAAVGASIVALSTFTTGLSAEDSTAPKAFGLMAKMNIASTNVVLQTNGYVVEQIK